MAYDLAEFTLGILKESEAVCDLVVDGADGIMETGDITAEILENAQKTRRETENPAKVLGITVMDAGEKASDEMTTEQRVGVWIWDRERGYHNIRPVTKAVYAALEGKTTPLESPLSGRTVAVILNLDRRSGHIIERSMEVDLEYILFVAVVKKDLG